MLRSGWVKLISVLILVTIIPTVASATTLTFLAYHEGQTELDRLAIERFERDHPGVNVDIMMQGDGYSEKLMTMIAAGVAPDIVIRDIGGTNLEWWLDGLLLDLTPYVKRNQAHFKDWIPEFANRGTFRGKTFAVARQMAGIYVNWFNRRLFDQAGLPYPDGSWNLDGFAATMRKLTVDHDGDGTPDQYGYHHAWKSWQPFPYDNGGGIVGASDPSLFLLDSPATLESLEYLQRLQFEDTAMTPDHRFSGSRALKAFSAGKAGMTFRSLTWYGALPEDMKDGTHLGLVLPPKAKGQRHAMSVVGGFSIPEASKNHDLAFELIKYLTDVQAQRDAKVANRGLVVNHRVNREFGEALPVWNYENVVAEMVAQPMFNAAIEMPDQAKDLMEEMVDSILRKNEMPARTALEKYIPAIKQAMHPFLSKMQR